MRQRTADLTGKMITVILACLMLLLMLPSGWLLKDGDSENTYGEIQKIYPMHSACVSADSGAGTEDVSAQGIFRVGNGFESYMQISVADIKPHSELSLTSAKLRLTVIPSGENVPKEISVAQVTDNKWNLPMTYAKRPGGEETVLATVSADEGLSSVLEIELIEAVRKWLSSEEDTVTLHIYANDVNSAVFASEHNEDGAQHPYLKLVWGNAADTDPGTASKAELAERIFVSGEAPDTAGGTLIDESGGTMQVDKNCISYVKFNFIRDNIRGAISKATLILHAENADENAVLLPSLLENSDWERSMSYRGRPKGKMEPFGSYRVNKGEFALDVTQAVSVQFQNNANAVTFILEGAGTMAFSGETTPQSGKMPRLIIETSEDPNIIAAHEAMAGLLKNNMSAEQVTTDLCGSYTSHSGTKATVEWQVYDADTGAENSYCIAANGKVTRPQWFEGEMRLRAVAFVQSGTCRLKRTLVLTLPPKAPPAFDAGRLENTVLVGDKKSEEKQYFDYVRGSKTKSRNIRGKTYTYRTLQKDGAMVFNLRCNPEAENILYIKLWHDDTDDEKMYFCDSNMRAAAKSDDLINSELFWTPVVLNEENTKRDSDGFVYASIKMPEQYTNGKEFLSLRLYRLGVKDEDEGIFRRSGESRGIYEVSLKSE